MTMSLLQKKTVSVFFELVAAGDLELNYNQSSQHRKKSIQKSYKNILHHQEQLKLFIDTVKTNKKRRPKYFFISFI